MERKAHLTGMFHVTHTHAQQQQQICRLKLPAALNKDVHLIHNSCILFIEEWRIVDSSSSWAW